MPLKMLLYRELYFFIMEIPLAQIVCENLTVGNSGRIACSGINFTVEKGDYLCITGTNGSGKSTLVKTLLGIQKPLSGKLIYGDGLTHSSVGYLPQHSENQKDFPASIIEIVRSGFLGRKRIHSFYTRQEKETVDSYLEMLGMLPYAGRNFSELSGGQQQRVLLARALCAGDSLLVLDEPVSGLDPAATEEMYDTILHLNREHEISVIMVSHDMDAVKRFSTKILSIG